jgi:hypothetical protein
LKVVVVDAVLSRHSPTIQSHCQTREVLQKSAKQHWAIGLRMGPAGPARSLVGRSLEKERCGTIFDTFYIGAALLALLSLSKGPSPEFRAKWSVVPKRILYRVVLIGFAPMVPPLFYLLQDWWLIEKGCHISVGMDPPRLPSSF